MKKIALLMLAMTGAAWGGCTSTTYGSSTYYNCDNGTSGTAINYGASTHYSGSMFDAPTQSYQMPYGFGGGFMRGFAQGLEAGSRARRWRGHDYDYEVESNLEDFH